MGDYYFLETITSLKDGTLPVSITNQSTKQAALSAMWSTLASACVNTDVVSCHVEVKNQLGQILNKETYLSENY